MFGVFQHVSGQMKHAMVKPLNQQISTSCYIMLHHCILVYIYIYIYMNNQDFKKLSCRLEDQSISFQAIKQPYRSIGPAEPHAPGRFEAGLHSAHASCDGGVATETMS